MGGPHAPRRWPRPSALAVAALSGTAAALVLTAAVPALAARPVRGPAPADLRAARSVAARFVLTAVLRRHVVDSWELAAPELRQGMSRATWRTGDIPVVPYPAADFGIAKWQRIYASGGRLGYEVLIWPRRGVRTAPQTFTMELEAFGRGRARHWLVDLWAPSGEGRPVAASPGDTYTPRKPIGAIWLLVPASLIALVVLVPTLVGIREWHAVRRADAAYRALRPR